MVLFLLLFFCLLEWVFIIFFFFSLQLGQCQHLVSREASVAQNTLTGQEFHLNSAWPGDQLESRISLFFG